MDELDNLKYSYEKLDLEYHRLKGQFKIVEEALNDNIKKVVELKAENEKLKTDIGIYKGIIDSDKEENKQLKQENERLSDSAYRQADYDYRLDDAEEKIELLEQENATLKTQYNCYACGNCKGKEDYINMKRHTENAIKTVHKYRQALQEIRDIADRTDGNHPASVINMVSVIRHTINSVIGEKE